jgi:ketosteroid isomerase-like protein
MESATSRRIATAQRVFELFNRLPLDAASRRASPVTAELLELFATDIEFSQPAMQPEGPQFFQGREQLRESWDQWFEMWEHHRSRPEEIVERGDRVLVLSRDSFRGRDGVELEQEGGAIFTFDGRKIVRFEAFFGHDTARLAFERMHRV